ncbi:hypothetical protein DES49_1859 [Halospina denitrificans]|uniref:Uncharacterized protein n=1 Tax=Halospina denitrificans TaxID=332522 RepID=A0A4R7JW73_9GAMM|nr:hypothetical protein [Halospina denitrificans]TDT41757.1 hypothetical protein DES49_1859 [Halospina denitrificans]
MPNYYEISPTDDTLTLRDGKASASFTVRYVGNRTVEARAQPVALKGANDAWLEVESPATREMEPNQTQNFKVSVKAPPGTPTGDYALRLDMVSVDNTDEEYDQGPTVSFKVEESKEPEPEPIGFPWWLVVVIAVVLVLAIGGGTWYALSGDGTDGEEEEEEDDEATLAIDASGWSGDYRGRLDGRNASLRIQANEAGDNLRLIQRDLDRNATTNGEVSFSGGDNAHIITGPFGDSNERLILHRHDRDLISMLGKWRGVSFGRVFARGGFDRSGGRNFDDDRWKAYWQGKFEGHTDGLESRLSATIGGNTVNLVLSVDNPDGGSTTYVGTRNMNPGSDPTRMHVLEGARLESLEGNETLTIKELLVHTWGSNYVTGIAEMPDGTEVGQIFIREKDVPAPGRFELIPIQPEIRMHRINPGN